MPASLLQLKVRGIRSYSPYEHRAQSIDFMPLTLIVGSNGSGKTTIIESLKFIISGSEPPLSDFRRNFIHASKSPNSSFDKNVPYASIELSFNNFRNEIVHAKRDIVRPINPKSAVVTPGISSCFRISNGPWKYINKQDEWGTTIPALFNLPNKAILSHVILCHQDDNLWCMGDSSSVKQIFDSIFGCEQYKKEIKHIDAEIKNCKSEVGIADRDVVYLKERVTNVRNLRDQLFNLRLEIEEIVKEEEGIERNIVQIAHERKEIQAEIGAFDKKEQDLQLSSVLILELEKREKEAIDILKDRLISLSELSDIELDKKMVQHSKSVDETKSKINDLRSLETNLTKDLARLDEEKEKAQKSLSKLQVIQLKSKDSERTLLEHLNNVKEEFKIEKIDLGNLEASLNALKNHELELKQNKSDQSQNEDHMYTKQLSYQRKLLGLESKLMGLQTTISGKERFIQKLRDQLEEASPLSKSIKRIGDNISEMHNITNNLPSSAQVTRLVDIINDTGGIVDGVLKKIQNDSILKITKQIEEELTETNTKKSELQDITVEKESMLGEQKNLEIEIQRARNLSKEAHNKLVSFSSRYKNLMTCHHHYKTELLFLEQQNMEMRLLDAKVTAQKYEEKTSQLASTKAELTKLSQEFTASFEISDSYRVNQSLRVVRNKLTEQRKISDKLKAELHQDDLTYQLKERLNEMEKQELHLRDRRAMMTGSKARIEGEHYRIGLDLERDKDTMYKYAEALGKVVCNTMILSDLEKLKECLNQSLLTFHNQMIAKINQVLRSRWRQIYKGTDIDTIELVDEEIVKKGNQKGYLYYIAMTKMGLRMKMREKGSAGQKALACLIIRMALAELFVKDFALIALDEPTSNLDVANVQSLAEAIGNYVKRRAKRGFNIQWIIITHDEEFLKALDSESSPYYYRIEMDSENCSKIQKQFYETSIKPEDKMN